MQRMESSLRRAQIAEAALAIMAHQGIGAVTVRGVAAAVGISAAALYRHYLNKTEILQAIMEEHQENFLANIRKAKQGAGSPLDALHRLYLLTMALVDRYYALPILFSSDVLWFKEPQLRAIKLHNHKVLRLLLVHMIKKAQAHGEMRRDLRAEEIAVYFIGLFAIPALLKARTPNALDLTYQITANWELFTRALSATDTSASPTCSLTVQSVSRKA